MTEEEIKFKNEVEPDYKNIHEAAKSGEFHELGDVDNLEKAYERIHKYIKEEREFMGEVSKAVAKPIAIHHHDFLTVVKEADKHLAAIPKMLDIMKEEELKKLEPEKAGALYNEIFHNLAEVDDDIRKSLMTVILLTRVYAGYYRVRVTLDKYLTYIGKKLDGMEEEPKAKKEIEHIIQEYAKAQKDMQEIVKTLVWLTRFMVPTGPLYKLVEQMATLCKDEGLKLEFRRIARHGMGTEFTGAGEGAK